MRANFGSGPHSDITSDRPPRKYLAVVRLAISFALMVVYFTPWFLFIEAVNAALIVSIVWLDWPSKTMVGA